MSPFIVCLLFPMLCIFRSMLFLCYSNVKINCAVLLTSIVRSLSRPKVNSFCSQSYCWCVGYIILSSYVIQFSCYYDSRSKPILCERIIGAQSERKRDMCPHVFGLHGTNVLFIWQQCTSTKISKNKKKKMKKKLKKQIEKQQQQQDEIEQGMLEENEEASDKETEKCCSNSMENCTENSTNCEQNDNELESNQLQEETVENLVDSELVENSEDLTGQSLQQKCIVTNDDMSVTEEQNEPGTQQLISVCFHLFYFLCQGVY